MSSETSHNGVATDSMAPKEDVKLLFEKREFEWNCIN